MNKIKFLFINAINISNSIESRYPPLGIGYLSSSLWKHFGEEAIEFKVIDNGIEEEILRFKPHIVGISSVSQNYNKAIKSAEIVKKYKLPVICGGVHISMLPYSLSKDMDIGVIGEGEETICEILGLFIGKHGWPEEGLSNIKGIAFWDSEGKIRITEKRGLITNLDELSLPARSLFNIRENSYMFTSRGCPYRCVFCASSRFWDKVRLFSADYVAREIAHLVNEHNVKSINFYDDLFAVDIQRVRDILALLKSAGILGKVEFSCAIRANLVKDEVIGLLKELGVNSIGLGLESGSEKTLEYLKHDVNIAQNKNAIAIIKKHRISVYGSFIIGSPTEEKKDILETFDFIKKSRLDGFNAYILTPYPGTPVWDYALSRGLVSEKMDWDALNINFEGTSNEFILLSENLSKDDFCELISKFKRYVKIHNQKKEMFRLIKKGARHPEQIMRFLKNRLKSRVTNKDIPVKNYN